MVRQSFTFPLLTKEATVFMYVGKLQVRDSKKLAYPFKQMEIELENYIYRGMNRGDFKKFMICFPSLPLNMKLFCRYSFII